MSDISIYFFCTLKWICQLVPYWNLSETWIKDRPEKIENQTQGFIVKFNFSAQCIMAAYFQKNAWQLLKPIFSQKLSGMFLFVAWFDFTRFFGEISFQCTVYNGGIFRKKIRQMPLHGNYQVQCFHKTHMNLPLIFLKNFLMK